VKAPPNETFASFYGLTTIPNIPSIQTYLPSGSYGVADINDNHLPVTYSYSFAVNQAFAHSIHVEMAYAGNVSRNLTGYKIGNAVPEGCPDELQYLIGYPANSFNDVQCRPYTLDGELSTVTHNLSSYYNSTQVTASKQTGRVTFWTTYTFGKALAYNCENPFDERRCYGAAPFDRSQQLNISYLINLPNVSSKYLGNNKVLNGVLDGWQFTGIEQFGPGTPLDFTAAASANGNTEMNTMACTIAPSISTALVRQISMIGTLWGRPMSRPFRRWFAIQLLACIAANISMPPASRRHYRK
jgi:hypothetical protein